jgi:hypothetical protein
MLVGLLLAAGAAVAAELSAEERLQAVRHGLAQKSLQGATQVQTTAWIDEKGALRESSSFRTGMQVRGVRVMAYSRDAQGQPQAQLQVQSPQDLLKPQAADTKAAGAKPATAAPAETPPPSPWSRNAGRPTPASVRPSHAAARSGTETARSW